MLQGRGKSVCDGVSIGTVYLYQKKKAVTNNRPFLGVEEETAALLAAVERARTQLGELYENTVEELGEEHAAIFEVHQMLLEDEDFIDAMKAKISEEQMVAAEAAAQAGEEFAGLMAAMDDDYMRERAADFRDISGRVSRILSGVGDSKIVFNEPVIVVAEDLEPSETVSFDKSMIRGFVLQKGSTNSHTAILARVMNVPSVVSTGIELDDSLVGQIMVVDGYEGSYIVGPTPEVLEATHARLEDEEKKRSALEALRGKDSISADGRQIHVYSNIGHPDDVDKVLEYDGEGIGLFRSEFLYLGRNDYPSEEEQFEAYKAVAERMNGKKVIIRTLDIGADKQAVYFQLPPEENPAMGLRAIRICLSNEALFKTQLRAILRASEYGNISIMFPMIISVEEVEACREQLEAVKAELRAEGKKVKDIEMGIMIETPAAVMMAEELAELVDFFSVGTNDLTQYTLAVDRQNEKIESYYNAKHPAIMKMLAKIGAAARQAGIWAGICGELGGDLTITEQVLQMGFEELSVSPGLTLKLREKIAASYVNPPADRV
ncbi:MAG: phosphoenolpyruvate--protein phosphotransferase [Lachnospiraceae bacterium]|nr:phosphoenolpyruvate--protein phosphotransferase [Lachnospiraceae bacterium]MDY5742760.1 phosphoenolpyruvate--protein phosphotransferase [Lachnospiraceae bacterium]